MLYITLYVYICVYSIRVAGVFMHQPDAAPGEILTPLAKEFGK